VLPSGAQYFCRRCGVDDGDKAVVVESCDAVVTIIVDVRAEKTESRSGAFESPMNKKIGIAVHRVLISSYRDLKVIGKLTSSTSRPKTSSRIVHNSTGIRNRKFSLINFV